MHCLNPTQAWKCGTKTAKDGVLSINMVFSPKEAMRYFQRICGSTLMAYKMMDDNALDVDCGKCINCLCRKRKAMSVRLQHEASMVDDVCFLTLTYDDAHMPYTGRCDWSDKDYGRVMLDRGVIFGEPTLLPADVQLFIKRLRRHLEYKPKRNNGIKRDHVDHPIRYFAVGEYGTKSQRPHYHILIFGWCPSDLTYWEDRGAYQIYRSAQVEKLWKYGFSTVCKVTPATCKYCARYVTKKLVASQDNPYVCPEFQLQSVRGGGIGAPWLDKYYPQLRNGLVNTYNRLQDGTYVVSRNTIPRYYLDRVRRKYQPFWLELRDERIRFLRSRAKAPTDYNDISRIAECEVQRLRNEDSSRIL